MMQVTDINTNSGKTKVHAMLKQAGISMRGIGRMTGLDKEYVIRALDSRHYVRERVENVTRVREKVEQMLGGAGYDTKALNLWSEYAIQLQRVA